MYLFRKPDRTDSLRSTPYMIRDIGLGEAYVDPLRTNTVILNVSAAVAATVILFAAVAATAVAATYFFIITTTITTTTSTATIITTITTVICTRPIIGLPSGFHFSFENDESPGISPLKTGKMDTPRNVELTAFSRAKLSLQRDDVQDVIANLQIS